MPAYLTDDQVDALLKERKALPKDYRARLARLRQKRGHKQGHVDARGVDGHEFRIAVRRSDANPLDFSVILQYRPEGSSEYLRLRRHNGDHGTHTNRIEGTVIRGPHIHTVTERYQELGGDPESFAVATGTFLDLHSALEALLGDTNCEAEAEDQLSLF